MPKYILGISAFYHDSAAALLQDGRIVAAAQEERFSRKKHDERFPKLAIDYCLKEASIDKDQLDAVVFYEKPFVKFERLLETYVSYAPSGFKSFIKSVPVWVKQKLWIKDLIQQQFTCPNTKILFTEHHQSHAASAFFASPFKEAAVVTMDGVGEWATTSIARGSGNQLKLIKEIRFPDSLGLLYSAFTYYAGFRVNSGEYKLMGLAPYGQPVYKDLILKHLMKIQDDGSFALDRSYFNYCQGLTMTSRKFHDLFGGPPRKAETKITQKDMDIARSIQDVTEELMIKICKEAATLTGSKNLCLAGGVALNCVGNGKISEQAIFDNIWIQPAAGDAGGALGAALACWHQYYDGARDLSSDTDTMSGSLLGPAYSNEYIQNMARANNYPYEYCAKPDIFHKVAALIDQGHVIGWCRGRMEFGPRALGARSIIGDARSTKMQETMNLKIKYRESFRPFAPSVLAEKAREYFDLKQDSPYMLLVAPVQDSIKKSLTEQEERLFGIAKLNIPKSSIPAVTHVDYSARVQTVDKKNNHDYYQLISALQARSGCAVIVNTSFNVRGEPLVCTPEDAYRCFMRTEMDYLVLEDCIFDKKNQPRSADNSDWRSEFALD